VLELSMNPEERAAEAQRKWILLERRSDRMATDDDLLRLIAAEIRAAVAEEREACAKLADTWEETFDARAGEVTVTAQEVAELIRARSSVNA
jgi:hypothetical protein